MPLDILLSLRTPTNLILQHTTASSSSENNRFFEVELADPDGLHWLHHLMGMVSNQGCLRKSRHPCGHFRAGRKLFPTSHVYLVGIFSRESYNCRSQCPAFSTHPYGYLISIHLVCFYFISSLLLVPPTHSYSHRPVCVHCATAVIAYLHWGWHGVFICAMDTDRRTYGRRGHQRSALELSIHSLNIPKGRIFQEQGNPHHTSDDA